MARPEANSTKRGQGQVHISIKLMPQTPSRESLLHILSSFSQWCHLLYSCPYPHPLHAFPFLKHGRTLMPSPPPFSSPLRTCKGSQHLSTCVEFSQRMVLSIALAVETDQASTMRPLTKKTSMKGRHETYSVSGCQKPPRLQGVSV